jgi:isopenicillin-N N-acyltransferase-like protein
MRLLELPAGKSPREWGRIHGESFRGEVGALAQIRIYLCTKVGGFKTREQVLAAAAAHVPVLERYHAGLYAELVGIAEGAKVSVEEIIVANHYTDLRDLDPDPATWVPAPTQDDASVHGHSASDVATGTGTSVADPTIGGDGCSVLFAESPTGRIVAQTWDMHATAIPYVMTLRVPESADGPACTLLTVTGCLGMAGMNTARVGVAINNLFSTDATLGVVWPAMVRRALHMTNAFDARDVITRSPIGSGHHYFVADANNAIAIETSGTRRKVIFQTDVDHDEQGRRPRSYCHTNHSFDPDVSARSKVPPTSTTYDRMKLLQADMAREDIADLDDAWKRLGSEEGWPRSINTNMATPESPHGAATCGAIAMNLSTGELYVQQGFIHNVAPEKWQL